MPSGGLFQQNVIAVVWDFDKTLTPLYMQKPLFDAYGIEEAVFWKEVNALPAYYARAGIHVHPDTCYLGHLLSYVRHGRFAEPPLTNKRLRELGADIEFYPGVPEVFARLRAYVDKPEYRSGDLRVEVEHYVVSTGLAELIRGSRIHGELRHVWASEFIEEPAAPGVDLAAFPPGGPISQIATFLDNTTKTRALFEVNKGVGLVEGISVNDDIAEEDRRVPFKNMIYVADGPSDIPSFSVVKKSGGLALAVYDPRDPRQYDQVSNLLERGRVHHVAPADYREDSIADTWLRRQVGRMAQRIVEERVRGFKGRIGIGPTHIGAMDRTMKDHDSDTPEKKA